jgi:rubrerythrin
MSTTSKLKRPPQYNNNTTTPQSTSEFEPLYPQQHARMSEYKEEEEAELVEEEPSSDSVKDFIVHYCRNCGYTVKDAASADDKSSCANCGDEMVLSTL